MAEEVWLRYRFAVDWIDQDGHFTEKAENIELWTKHIAPILIAAFRRRVGSEARPDRFDVVAPAEDPMTPEPSELADAHLWATTRFHQLGTQDEEGALSLADDLRTKLIITAEKVSFFSEPYPFASEEARRRRQQQGQTRSKA